jgi:hypothetical protein
MPLEIRELNIRVNLNDSGNNQDNSASTANGSAGGIASEEARDALIAAVVEKVMTILKDKNER